MKDENPSRYLGYLQQCLSSDKKPLGIFLGAGCPMAVRVGADGKFELSATRDAQRPRPL